MSAQSRVPRACPRRTALLAALLLGVPMTLAAQTAPAPSGSSAPASMSGMSMGTMPGMDHGSMADLPMPAAPAHGAAPAASKPRRKPPAPAPKDRHAAHGMGDMPGMQHEGMTMPVTPTRAPAVPASIDRQSMDGMPGMQHGAAQDAAPAAMPPMSMGPMQGGDAPAGARSPDYSDGLGYGAMRGMDMADNAPLGMALIDQLEAFDGRAGHGQSWEAQAWYGTDRNKLWLRSEGERSSGRVQDADVEALWSHGVTTYWDTQLGARHDFGTGPARSWAAFGVQGLAPYWFELEATGYVGSSGRTAARVRVDYEVLFTQRLILQPEAEINLYGRRDPQRRLGAGVTDLQFGLRLRYEIRRRFAPYIGVNWLRRTGGTAGYARQDHQPVLDRQWVAGVRLWF